MRYEIIVYQHEDDGEEFAKVRLIEENGGSRHRPHFPLFAPYLLAVEVKS